MDSVKQMTQGHQDVPATLAKVEAALAEARSREDIEVVLRQTADLVAALGGYYHSRVTEYRAEQAMAAYVATCQVEEELHRVVIPFLHNYNAERTVLGLMRLLRLVRQTWELL
jgi:hypothetical protein